LDQNIVTSRLEFFSDQAIPRHVQSCQPGISRGATPSLPNKRIYQHTHSRHRSLSLDIATPHATQRSTALYLGQNGLRTTAAETWHSYGLADTNRHIPAITTWGTDRPEAQGRPQPVPTENPMGRRRRRQRGTGSEKVKRYALRPAASERYLTLDSLLHLPPAQGR
jgi:hypothetical protein